MVEVASQLPLKPPKQRGLFLESDSLRLGFVERRKEWDKGLPR